MSSLAGLVETGVALARRATKDFYKEQLKTRMFMKGNRVRLFSLYTTLIIWDFLTHAMKPLELNSYSRGFLVRGKKKHFLSIKIEHAHLSPVRVHAWFYFIFLNKKNTAGNSMARPTQPICLDTSRNHTGWHIQRIPFAGTPHHHHHKQRQWPLSHLRDTTAGRHHFIIGG